MLCCTGDYQWFSMSYSLICPLKQVKILNTILSMYPSIQACALCTTPKTRLASIDEWRASDVKHDCVLDAHREDIIGEAEKSRVSSVEFFRSARAKKLSSERGVRPNRSGLSGFAYQPTLKDIPQRETRNVLYEPLFVTDRIGSMTIIHH